MHKNQVLKASNNRKFTETRCYYKTRFHLLSKTKYIYQKKQSCPLKEPTIIKRDGLCTLACTAAQMDGDQHMDKQLLPML